MLIITIMKVKTMEKNQFLTIKDVASKLKISVSTIDKQLALGCFPQADYRIVSKRLWRSETIETFLEENCKNERGNGKKK